MSASPALPQREHAREALPAFRREALGGVFDSSKPKVSRCVRFGFSQTLVALWIYCDAKSAISRFSMGSMTYG
jgi:hypothetical protein